MKLGIKKLSETSKKKLIIALLLLLFFVLIPVSIFAFNHSKDLTSDASDSISMVYEAEKGKLSGNVVKVSDSNASRNSYIRFGSMTTSPSSTNTNVILPTQSPTSAAASPSPSPSMPPSTGSFPAEVINLTNWKQTLPIGNSESPTEIKQPALATYKLAPWFIVNPAGGVRFRAPVSAVTTSGSNYPRSELREMTNNGTVNANWSSTSGTHTMFIDQSITAIPQGKKHIVAGQIHDSKDDVIVIRLEDKKLFIDIAGNDGPVLNANYALGTRFTVKFEASGGLTKIYYNGSSIPSYTLSKSYSNSYFKAGAYTQSNCTTELDKGVTPCLDSNYGEVIIYDLKVTHQ